MQWDRDRERERERETTTKYTHSEQCVGLAQGNRRWCGTETLNWSPFEFGSFILWMFFTSLECIYLLHGLAQHVILGVKIHTKSWVPQNIHRGRFVYDAQILIWWTFPSCSSEIVLKPFFAYRFSARSRSSDIQ